MNKIINSILLASLLATSASTFASVDKTTNTTRIVGGEQSIPAQWPFIVSIKSKRLASHFCGASLIAPQWVLTAAHCLFESNGEQTNASDISVTVGEYNLASSPETASTNVAQVFTHPDYDSEFTVNDIALLRLSEAVTNATISTVNLADTNDFVSQKNDVTAIGWGSTVAYEPGVKVNPIYPDILRQVTQPLNTDQECSTYLGSNYTTEMICAGFEQGGTDSCQGDSGGPLVIETDSGWQQLGIVSWGFGCAAAGNPGAYTKLALYADWIENITEKASITESTRFNYTVVNSSDIKLITVTNSSNNSAEFNYSFSGSDFFIFDASNCSTIAANSDCQISVMYAPTDTQAHSASITLTSNINDSSAITANLSGKPLVNADALLFSVGLTVANSGWATGGDNNWSADSSNTALQSGTITDTQQSILMTTITGKGRLQFDWASSSENGYDFLTLNINGVNIKEISGDKSFLTKNIYLHDAINKVVWTYKKDGSESAFNDQASLRNISFELMTRAEYEIQLADEGAEDMLDEVVDDLLIDIVSSSSGSIGFMVFLLMPLVFIRRYYS